MNDRVSNRGTIESSDRLHGQTSYGAHWYLVSGVDSAETQQPEWLTRCGLKRDKRKESKQARRLWFRERKAIRRSYVRGPAGAHRYPYKARGPPKVDRPVRVSKRRTVEDGGRAEQTSEPRL